MQMENVKEQELLLLYDIQQTLIQQQWKKEYKEGHDIIIKILIQQDLSNSNVYTPNLRVSSFRKQTLLDLRKQMGGHTIIVRDFIIPLTALDISSRQKQINYGHKLHSWLNLIHIYRKCQPTNTEYTFFHLHMKQSPKLTICLAPKEVSIH